MSKISGMIQSSFCSFGASLEQTILKRRDVMPDHTSLGRRSLVHEAEEAIKALIYDHKLGPGDPLPTEDALRDRLGVSRNSLREALKVLEATGIVVIRHGHGMTVGQMDFRMFVSALAFRAHLSTHEGPSELRDLLEMRALLESSLVMRAGAIMAESDHDALAEAVEIMEKAAHHGDFSPAGDRLFHERLYAPLNNTFVEQFLAAFWDVLELLEDDLPASNDSPTKTATEHRKIYESLRSGEIAEAASMLEAHFRGITDRLERASETA